MKTRVIMLFILFSLSIFADKINFSIISTGGFRGRYKRLDSIKVAIDQLEKEKLAIHDNVIKINVGNNASEYKVKNDVILSFMNKVKFNFNFLGKEEFIWRDKIDQAKARLSTINIIKKDVLPYQLMKMNDKLVVVAGITNIYEEDVKGKLDYKAELKNLMTMLEDNIDFFILVTDLKRDENVKLIKEFPFINVILESRPVLYDFGVETVKFKNETIPASYIIPNYEISILDFSFDDKDYNIDKKQVGFRLKKAKLLKRENILRPERFGFDGELKNYISWTIERVKNENSIILGYNEHPFNPYEIHLADRVGFLDDLADKLQKSFKADITIFPKKSLISGLKRGLFTRLEVQNMFATEKMISFKLTNDQLRELIAESKKHRGKEEYFYLSGLDKNPLMNEYKIISFENVLEAYGKIIDKDKITIEKIGIREFLINK